MKPLRMGNYDQKHVFRVLENTGIITIIKCMLAQQSKCLLCTIRGDRALNIEFGWACNMRDDGYRSFIIQYIDINDVITHREFHTMTLAECLYAYDARGWDCPNGPSIVTDNLKAALLGDGCIWADSNGRTHLL